VLWHIPVLSGKGGVGKSTVSTFLAESLSKTYPSGLLDLDLQAPDDDLLLHGTKVKDFRVTGKGFYPAVYKNPSLEVMSLAYQMPDKTAMLWSGSRRAQLVVELASKVVWSKNIRFIVVDTPPGTGDEVVSTLLTFKKSILGVILVTQARDVSLRDVKKTVTMCGHLNIPILGVVQNMSYVKCKCGANIPLFDEENVSKELGVPVIATLPFKKDLSVKDFEPLARKVLQYRFTGLPSQKSKGAKK